MTNEGYERRINALEGAMRRQLQRAEDLRGELAERDRRIEALEAFAAQLRNQPGFPTDGRQFALKFPMLAVGPLGERYSIVRVAGGHLSTVAAPAASTDWSNA